MFILKAAGVFLTPVIIFIAFAELMNHLAGRESGGRPTLCPETQTYLNMRLLGYDKGDVERHWGHSDIDMASEKKFLKLDLVFPFIYGAVFAVALLMASKMEGQSIKVPWLLIPVVLMLLGDWTENVVQLGQLNRFTADPTEALATSWIKVASIGTIVKLWSGLATVALLGGLLLRAVWQRK